jgi:hypothetical protein
MKRYVEGPSMSRAVSPPPVRMPQKHAPGATRADPTKPSIATLPYELQVAIFEAAAGPQVIFMDITDDVLTFARPADQGLAQTCQLARQIYVQSRTLRRFGDHAHWIDSERDIFYLYRDDPVVHTPRPNSLNTRMPKGETFDSQVIQNVAVDLQYLGVHPRFDPVVRIWIIFPHLRTIHIFVPSGPPQTPTLRSTPETLALSIIPGFQVVAAPGMDKELWYAVRYQIKKVCARILTTENGWHGRSNPDVVGHLTSLSGPLPEGTKEGNR